MVDAPSIQHSISIPGKVFLVGEYSVLAGGPILGMTVGPRFEATSVATSPSDFRFMNILAPDSPAGKWLARTDAAKSQRFFWKDPIQTGGLGASTAQFIAAYWMAQSDLTERPHWQDLLEAYWSPGILSSTGLRPSGADLITQWLGGVVLYDPSQASVTMLQDIFPSEHFVLFSATDRPERKTATHLDLAKWDPKDFFGTFSDGLKDLKAITLEVVRSISAADLQGLGSQMTAYAERLAQMKLESQAAREDRLFFSSMPGVLGCKGSGAQLSDIFVILVDSPKGHPFRNNILAEAQRRGLRLLADGLSPEKEASIAQW